MFTTDAGLGVLTAALMGLVLGIAVVAQTIYAATMDHVPTDEPSERVDTKILRL